MYRKGWLMNFLPTGFSKNVIVPYDFFKDPWMFSKFKKRLLQKKLFILPIVILLSGPTLESAQNEPASLSQPSSICSAYGKKRAQKIKGSEGQERNAGMLRSEMERTKKTSLWLEWQQQLTREVSHNDHVQALLELGFEMKSVDGHQIMVPPEDLLVPIEMYNHRVLKMIEEGQLKKSEAIFATILFVSWIGIPGMRRRTKKFRPGIDELPSVYRWRFDPFSTVSHYEWARLMASGHMPVSLNGQFYIHDLAHITENLQIDPHTQRPEFMIATRTIYREQKKIHNNPLRELAEYQLTQPEPESIDSFRHSSVFLRRSFDILEYMFLGRLDSEAELRALRPELFGNQTSLEALQQSLQGLSFRELDMRLKYWLENERQFVLRQGGVARDMVQRKSLEDVYYLLNKLGEWEGTDNIIFFREHLASYLRNTKIVLDYILRTEELLGQGWMDRFDKDDPDWPFLPRLIEELSEIRKSLDAEDLEAAKGAVVDQLARFEMGLVKSVELKITPGQLVYDLAGARVRPNSPSVEWLRSYLNPSQGAYYQFISHR